MLHGTGLKLYLPVHRQNVMQFSQSYHSLMITKRDFNPHMTNIWKMDIQKCDERLSFFGNIIFKRENQYTFVCTII